MRRLLIYLLLIFISMSLGYVFSNWGLRNEFSGVLWEAHEVIVRQKPEIGTVGAPTIPKFHSLSTYITLIYLDNGTFTASITTSVNYNSGATSSFTREVIGSWARQGGYLNMKIKNYNPLIGDLDDQVAIEWIKNYEKILLSQTYIVSCYKERLILVSLHEAGGVLTLIRK